MGNNFSHFSDDEWCYVPIIGLQGTYDFRAVCLPNYVPQQVREKYPTFPDELWINVVLKILKPGFQEYSGFISYGYPGMIFFNIVFALLIFAVLFFVIPILLHVKNAEGVGAGVAITWLIVWFILRSLQRIKGEGALRDKINELSRAGPKYKFKLFDPNADGKADGNKNTALFLMVGLKNSLEYDRWQENEGNDVEEHYITDFYENESDNDVEVDGATGRKMKKSPKKNKNGGRSGHRDRTGIDYYDEDYGGLGDFHGKKEKRKAPIYKHKGGTTSTVHVDIRHTPH